MTDDCGSDQADLALASNGFAEALNDPVAPTGSLIFHDAPESKQPLVGVISPNDEAGVAPPLVTSEAESPPKRKPREVNDLARKNGLDRSKADETTPSVASVPRPEEEKPPARTLILTALADIKTATALQFMTFEALKYIVPDLIVEGCVLLAGKPKAGKSWFVLDVGLAVACGGYCLGDKKCEQGDVLYLALEDGDRRLQRRITKLLPTFGGKWPERFQYVTKWPRANEGGIEAIDEWCETHPDVRLVMIDVLAKSRAPSSGKGVYQQDYALVSRLQELAVRRSITILIVHHTRKGASDDPVEEISGTLGLGGGVDAFLVLKRTGSGATLTGRGRDIEDVDLAVQFNRETCRWIILGEAAEVRLSNERGRVLNVLEEAEDGLSVVEIMRIAQLISRGAADVLLSNMAKQGQVERVKRGVYRLPGTNAKIAAKQAKKAKKQRLGGKSQKYQKDNVHSKDLSDLRTGGTVQNAQRSVSVGKGSRSAVEAASDTEWELPLGGPHDGAA
jgi:AAA domain